MIELLFMMNYNYFVRYRLHGYTIGMAQNLQSEWIFYYASR